MQLHDCSQPWFEMQICYDHTVGCCCYYHGKPYYWDFKSSFDIQKIWNSDEFVSMRQIIASSQTKGSGCEECQWLKYADRPQFIDIPASVSPRISANWKKALDNYNNRNITVDSYPVKYYFNFGVSCNIRCIMCSQEHIRRGESHHLPAEPLLAMKSHLIMADQIHVIGGEPLMIPSARTFLEGILGDPDYSDTMLAIYSNGTLLHHYLERFRGMRRMNVCFSLDSIGETYEYIRHGGKWNQVERNILDFKELGQQLGFDWQTTIACVIMKSSIATLDKFVDWCVSHDTPCHFVPLAGVHPAADEDVFKNPALLDSIPEWEDTFDRAIDALKRKGWIAGRADSLQKIRDDLAYGYREFKAKKALEEMIQVAAGCNQEMARGLQGYISKAQSLLELKYFDRLQQFCDNTIAGINSANQESVLPTTVTPASAYWNQRHQLERLKERFIRMSDAVNHKSDLNLYQWMQIAATSLEFKPDLILELGRGRGNSTCIFTEVANILGGSTACTVTSLCMSCDFVVDVVPRLFESHVIDKNWFQPLDCWYTDILAFDFESLLKNKKRVLVFWDAHGFEVAGCMLGRILPQLVGKQHMVIMHDMSDQRYISPESLQYNGERLWRGNNWEGPRIVLGNINSAVEQAVSITDFSTRNNFELLSADHSNHTEIKPYPEKVAEMRQILGDEFFQLQGHWFCFSLNTCQGPFTFPRFQTPEKYLVDDPIELLAKLNLK